MHKRGAILLLNVAHAVDHMFLLIFATAVASIAAEFGFARWEDLMPFGVGAFVMFGLGSLPSGRLGDLWGRRAMMIVFFFGIGASSLLAALAQGPWQLAAALTLIGTFASIYHPVGIPMLLQGATRPGATIGVNGLAGNLGIAVAAALTGLLMQWLGWRAAFAVPGLACLALGIVFMRVVPRRASRRPSARAAPGAAVARAGRARAGRDDARSATGGILFNLTTNGNAQLLRRTIPRRDERSGDARLAAGEHLRGRVAGAGRGRPADRPGAAQAALPRHRLAAGAGPAVRVAGRRAGRSTPACSA